MESKLLVGGKNIIDHTNEQQKMLEIKRQEIAEQVKRFFCSSTLIYSVQLHSSYFRHTFKTLGEIFSAAVCLTFTVISVFCSLN